MNTRKYMKLLFLNPLTEYFHFLFNWSINRLKYKKISQEYMSFIYKSDVKTNVKIFKYAIVNKSTINSYSYIGERSRVRRTSIGKFCCIGPNCILGPGLHPSSNFVSIHPIFFSMQKQIDTTFADKNYYQEHANINIGNDVWIGTNVVVMDGVSIGDGAIIGAGAVVTKDVPAYAVYGGIPAKLIHYRFDKKVIDFLLEFKWWEKDESWLRNNFMKFHSITKFVQSYAAK